MCCVPPPPPHCSLFVSFRFVSFVPRSSVASSRRSSVSQRRRHGDVRDPTSVSLLLVSIVSLGPSSLVPRPLLCSALLLCLCYLVSRDAPRLARQTQRRRPSRRAGDTPRDDRRVVARVPRRLTPPRPPPTVNHRPRRRDTPAAVLALRPRGVSLLCRPRDTAPPRCTLTSLPRQPAPPHCYRTNPAGGRYGNQIGGTIVAGKTYGLTHLHQVVLVGNCREVTSLTSTEKGFSNESVVLEVAESRFSEDIF